MLCAMPDSFFSSVLMDEQSFKLPPLGDYAVGMVSLSWGTATAQYACSRAAATRGLLCSEGLSARWGRKESI